MASIPLRTSCPDCGAAIGEMCVNDDGLYTGVHLGRLERHGVVELPPEEFSELVADGHRQAEDDWEF